MSAKSVKSRLHRQRPADWIPSPMRPMTKPITCSNLEWTDLSVCQICAKFSPKQGKTGIITMIPIILKRLEK